jgi:hypothetical protein
LNYFFKIVDRIRIIMCVCVCVCVCMCVCVRIPLSILFFAITTVALVE